MNAQNVKTFTINQILTEAEIVKAVEIYNSCEHGVGFARRCSDEIIKPVIGRINAALGQENDPDYIAYAVMFACQQTEAEDREAARKVKFHSNSSSQR